MTFSPKVELSAGWLNTGLPTPEDRLGPPTGQPPLGTPGSGLVFPPYIDYLEAHMERNGTIEDALTFRYWSVSQDPRRSTPEDRLESQSQVAILGTPGSRIVFQPYADYIQAYRQEHGMTENALTSGIGASARILESPFADSGPFLPTAVFCNRTTQTSPVIPIFHHLHVASQSTTYHHIFRLICALSTQHCDFVVCCIYKYHTLEVIGEENDTGSMEDSILSQNLPS